MVAKFTNPLEKIKIASPCAANWDEMIGNNRQRFCGECKLTVYNLSGMSRREAENLLVKSEGRLCARFFRRADGTILTADCPVGWQKVKLRMTKIWTALASVIFTALGGIGINSFVNRLAEIDPVTLGATTKTALTEIENQSQTKIVLAPDELGEVVLEPKTERFVMVGRVEYEELSPADAEPAKNDRRISGTFIIDP